MASFLYRIIWIASGFDGFQTSLCSTLLFHQPWRKIWTHHIEFLHDHLLKAFNNNSWNWLHEMPRDRNTKLCGADFTYPVGRVSYYCSFLSLGVYSETCLHFLPWHSILRLFYFSPRHFLNTSNTMVLVKRQPLTYKRNCQFPVLIRPCALVMTKSPAHKRQQPEHMTMQILRFP